ncbi:MAG: AbrB family transcriptional regulator, partial [Rubrivivax sp.]
MPAFFQRDTWAAGAWRLVTLALAWAAARACEALGTPLPWMIGPLMATAATALAGLPVRSAPVLRNVGQWTIGMALGLYFTPQVVALLPGLFWPMVLGGVWALLIGYAFYRWLWWTQRMQPGMARETAFFAAAIGGASEMALMADRSGGRIDLVAASHSLRLMLVVMTMPFALQGLGVHGSDLSTPGVQVFRLEGLAILLALTAVGIAVVWRLGGPNPWVLGSLAVSILLTASDVQLSAMPKPLSNAGQLFIGVALGSRFTPAFVRVAPRWLAAVGLGTVGMIAASAVFALVLARLTGLSPATLVLGTSPGGIAEMCITAKVLQLGVPTVTAMH